MGRLAVSWVIVLVAGCAQEFDKSDVPAEEVFSDGEDGGALVTEADGDTDADADTDTDSDADADTDTDSDADADTDTDSDADADTDTDTDVDCEDIPNVEEECCPDCPAPTCEDFKYLDCPVECEDLPYEGKECCPEPETPTCADIPDVEEVCCPAPPAPELRMTGGGVVYLGDGRRDGIVSHGFQLRCDADDERQNLEVNWFHTKSESYQFHLLDLTSAYCTDEGDETPPSAGFTTFTGTGTGRCDESVEGTVSFVFRDFGEPGREDELELYIVCAGVAEDLTVTYGGYTRFTGNHQAH